MSEPIDTTTEVWKTIEEFPKYSVSNLGRIRKDVKPIQTAGGILNPRPNEKGYSVIRLIRDKKRYGLKVSRLVAKAFLEPDPFRPEVNHKNTIKSDNRASNLEWATRLENMRHAQRTLKPWQERGMDRYCAKLTDDDVRKIRTLLSDGMFQRSIGELYGISQGQVSRIKLGTSWRHV